MMRHGFRIFGPQSQNSSQVVHAVTAQQCGRFRSQTKQCYSSRLFQTLCLTSRTNLSSQSQTLSLVSKLRHQLSRRKKILSQCERQASTGLNRNRVKALMYATYVSGTIGFLLLSAIAYRYYGRFQKRARGIEELDVPLYGRRSRLFCRYRGYVLPSSLINTISNDVPWFEVRPDDIWVVSFPKAGTTWLQEIVYLISTDFDYESASTKTLDDRFPYLEWMYPGLKSQDKYPSPRFIKSHLPFSLLPKQFDEKKPKVVYIARNPKDTAVSLMAFVHLLTFFNFHGTIDDFADLFAEGIAMYGPWWKHVQEGWERRNDENVLFVTYEDLHKNFRGTVKDIASFLGKPVTESQLEALERHTSFAKMKGNDSVNYTWHQQQGLWRDKGHFMRKGEVGDWKNHLKPETSAKLDTLAAKLENLGLNFVDS